MARIRTIKPELWTDPDFVECSTNARLLFVAALNFASDYGVLPDKPKQLKMQCFPGDAFDLEPLVDELIERGFWQRRLAPDGANVLVIRTFTQHQKVDRPNLGRWGDPAKWSQNRRTLDEHSTNNPRPLDERSPPEGNGREGNGKESSSSANALSTQPVDNPDDDDDYSKVLEMIADAKVDEYQPTRPRAYKHKVRVNANIQDGDLIRTELANGLDPERVAMLVLGYGHEATRERIEQPWCTSDCQICDGDGWTHTGDGLAPCPNRTQEAHA